VYTPCIDTVGWMTRMTFDL